MSEVCKMASKLAGWQFTSKHAVVEQLHGFDIEDIANWMAGSHVMGLVEWSLHI